MKAYFIVRPFCVASILFLVMFLSGCSTTRYLADNEQMVKRVRIEGIDKQFAEQAKLYVLKDLSPVSWQNRALYNVFNTKNGKYRTDRIKDIGGAPNLLDSSLVEISRREIEKFLMDKSFFNASVKSNVVIEKKRAYITFTAQPGQSFKIRNFTYSIPDSAVKDIYLQKRPSFTQITEGSRYDGDSLRNERMQIFNLLQQRGYFDYKQQYVKFSVDTHLYAGEANIKMILDNPENQPAHKVYHINNTSMLVRTSKEKATGNPDTTVIDSQFFFRDYSHRFKPKTLYRYNYLKQGELYNIDKKNLTYDRLFDLNVFRTVKIDYVKTKDSTSLDARIDVTPMKRLSNRLEGEYTFSAGRSGFNIANTYTNRNIFGGAEQLDFRVRYGALSNFNRDLTFSVNLTFPKLFLPFNTSRVGKYGVPHTIISSSLQLFDQLNAFQSRLFINSLTYDWIEARNKLHSFTPVNIEYRKGIFNNAFKEQLIKEGYRQYVQTNDRQYVNIGSQYTFTLNASKLLTYKNFIYFRTFNDVGGNALSLLAGALKNDGTIFGLPYLQYSKTEADVRLYRSLGSERQFVARVNPGIAYPYGNSQKTGLPFEKNFYAGGSSGIRGWQARTLGPGNYNRKNIADSIRRNITNLDQLGEVKLEANLEYRFKILENLWGSTLRGAAFTDFGNIWRIRKSDTHLGGEIQLNKLFDQIAIGAGAGLRYDVDYFILRLDFGVKIKDPQFQGQDQWVITKFLNRDLRNEYEQTNAPDKYRFIQTNFGIGMPF